MRVENNSVANERRVSRKAFHGRWLLTRHLHLISCVCLMGGMGLAQSASQAVGTLRGIVHDKDFSVPLPGVKVVRLDTGESVQTTDQGNYSFPSLPAGKYTLVFSKAGYLRQIRADVVVVAGKLSEVEVWMLGDFTEMEEFVVDDSSTVGVDAEGALLELRLTSPAMLDSISVDLMSRAGATDAAGALRLVAGATVKDGKTAVIRGLPDRYVSSQLNGVRLPSADEDKRAVELDQFPAAVIEGIEVSKTFTPDQQGDASGGAVDVRLRGIPEQGTFYVRGGMTYNSQVTGRGDFLSYPGGGVNSLGSDSSRNIQWENIGGNWNGAVGTSAGNAPVDGRFSIGAGDRWDLGGGWDFGAFGSFFYERDNEFSDDGVNDSLWVDTPGGPLVPEYTQGAPDGAKPESGDFRTKLFDVVKGTESVQWGILGILGIENKNNRLGLTYLYSRTAEDTATLAENTRGKQYYFPGYDPYDPSTPGHGASSDASPYLRLETLQYTERTTGSLQLDGSHTLPFGESKGSSGWEFSNMEFDWVFAKSFAAMNQPDKRQFGAYWQPERVFGGGFTIPSTYYGYKPAANFALGNVQRIWKTIEEESTQLSLAMKWPFLQWDREEGYLKVGLFGDSVDRAFTQESFSNFGDSSASFEGDWSESWSAQFPFEDHPMTASEQDVDYDGYQNITAYYGMIDLPVSERTRVVTGARWESTEIGIVNKPEADAVWFPPGFSIPTALAPGDADVSLTRNDILPSIGVIYEATDALTLRASYSQTIARQSFKELTPILQQEFLGGPIFIGNPSLEMSSLENYDLRLDYRPDAESLLSFSWFFKDISKPIEYVQRATTFGFTTPVNYASGRMSGLEFEARQGLGPLFDALDGVSVGANATFIDSLVKLPADEIAAFSDPAVQAPMSERDMTGAPEYMYNLYVTYDIEPSDTHLGLFYNVQGDTLLAGAALDDNNLIPNIYSKEFDTLNFSLTQGLGNFLTLTAKAKNLTNARVETFYRSDYIPSDTTRTAYSRGIEYSLSLRAEFSF